MKLKAGSHFHSTTCSKKLLIGGEIHKEAQRRASPLNSAKKTKEQKQSPVVAKGRSKCTRHEERMKNRLTNLRCCAISIAFVFVALSLVFFHGNLLHTGRLVGSSQEETNFVNASTSFSATEQGSPSIPRTSIRNIGLSQRRSMQSISIVPIEEEDDDDVEDNVFQDPVGDEEAFNSKCVDFLLSDPIVADQSITNIEYTTFLLDYCGGEMLNINEDDVSSTCGATVTATIQQQRQSLSYFSLNADLRFKFFYTACPFHTPEGTHCLTDFDMAEFGILVDSSTAFGTSILEERIQSLCSETYKILTKGGLFDDLSINDNTVGDQQLSPSPFPSQRPSSSPISSPTESPIHVPTPTVVPPTPAISTTTPPINFVPTIIAATGTSSPTSANSAGNNDTDAPTPAILLEGNSIIKNKDGRFTTPAILGFISMGWAVAFICAVLCSSGGWKDQVYDSEVYEPSASEAAGGGGGLSPTRTSPRHRIARGGGEHAGYSKQSSSPDTTAGDENSSSSASPAMGQRHSYDEERGGRGRR